MFFILSKTLFFLIQPLTIITILLLWGLLVKKKEKRRKIMIATVLVLLFFSNSFIFNEIMLWWEIPPTPIKEMPTYDLGIVMTGVANTQKSPHDRVYFQKGADRVTHAIQLYKQGLIKRILITGGSSRLIKNDFKEADNLITVFLNSGIPANDLIIENQARNTYESAVNCAKLISKDHPGQKCLLITSAFHLRRAQGCFEKAGLAVTGFSTDFYTYDRKFTPDVLLLPSSGALKNWSYLIKEWTGITAYKIMGYL